MLTRKPYPPRQPKRPGCSVCSTLLTDSDRKIRDGWCISCRTEHSQKRRARKLSLSELIRMTQKHKRLYQMYREVIRETSIAMQKL